MEKLILKSTRTLRLRLLAVGVVFCLITTLSRGAAPVSASTLPPGVKHLEALGVHNLFALGNGVFSGSVPEGEEGFASLARLGVKTIITVDGARPDADTAHKFGMRYVHLPHGYDGISTNTQALLAKAGRDLPGPIFVHCHHGKHRGPAAAAVICMADKGWSREQAEAYLHAAGTATNYAGLYATVRNFTAPSQAQLEALPAGFPEAAKVSGLVDAMVQIDERWELMKAIRTAGYVAPKEHPDLQPANEAVILWEHYREAQRLPETSTRGGDLPERFKNAENDARATEQLLRQFAAKPEPSLKSQLDQKFDALAKSCSSCHKAHRD